MKIFSVETIYEEFAIIICHEPDINRLLSTEKLGRAYKYIELGIAHDDQKEDIIMVTL